MPYRMSDREIADLLASLVSRTARSRTQHAVQQYVLRTASTIPGEPVHDSDLADRIRQRLQENNPDA